MLSVDLEVRKLAGLNNCELGRLRNRLSHTLDQQIEKKLSIDKSQYTLTQLAAVVKESEGRKLSPTGMLGICNCKHHLMSIGV